jgi:hypothetical protein
MTSAGRAATAESGALPDHAPMTLRQVVMLSGAIGISTSALVYVAHQMLPNLNGYVGHDYRYFFPYLLAGAGWIKQNGWFIVPHFTPDFCGGIPWLANPQSLIYSVPQILTLFFADPVAAAKWSLLFYATAGGAMTYLLLRRCFRLSWHAAGLGFVLFQLNGFLIFRIGIGHLPYHIYGLMPGLCLCALVARAPNRPVSQWATPTKDIAAAVAGACLLAVMIYGGALNYIIPAVLTVGAIIFISQAGKGFHLRPWLLLASACMWAIPLSALKLLPAAVFALSYPRTYLVHYLFDSPLRLAKTLFRAFFIPEIQPSFTTMNYADNIYLSFHELEFGVSVVPLFLILAGLILAYRLRRAPRHLFAWIGLALIAAIPILGTFGNATWGQVLLRIPVINNNTMLTRWWSIYILILIVLAALSFDRVFRRTWARDVVFGGCVIIAAAQLTLRDLTYYTTGTVFPLYDPAPVTAAVRQVLVNGDALPQITQLGSPTTIVSPREDIIGVISAGQNDGLLTGISALPCYEAIFGYSQEMFPARGLQIGPLDRQSAGLLNMADPRCYLTPGPNACRPGDRFRSNDAGDLVAFASHQPLHWQQPTWQIAARLATVVSLSLSVVIFLVFGLCQLFKTQRTSNIPTTGN